MNKNEINEGLELIINSLVKNKNNENKKYIENILEKIKNSNYNVDKPEKFNFFLNIKLDNILKQISKSFYNIENDKIKDYNKPSFIFTKYDFLEKNIRKLCILREGNSCCADKSRFILNMYFKYSLTGEIPNFDPLIEEYYIPKFGTYKEWIELCDGLYKLYYGETEKYFESYLKLIKLEKRKYKHILNKWFLKFKDGETIFLNYSWDNNTNNILDNEFFNKENYYIIDKSKLNNRKYEEFVYNEFLGTYCKVPKEDIDNIYMISEEVMS